LQIRIFALVALLGLAFAQGATAEPGLGAKVYAPYIRNGVTEVETRVGRLTGGPSGGDATAVVELEKGLNDWLSMAVLGEFEKHPGERSKLDSLGVEGVIYLGQIPRLGVDTALYLEYEQRLHNESGVGEGKLIFAKTVDRFQGLLNLIATHPFTSRPDDKVTEFGYAASATWEASPGLRLGAEAFGDVGTNHRLGGRNPHYLGPALTWERRTTWLGGADFELQAGYLFALGAARRYTDGQLRLGIELERRF
jgi:hypothetical protein